MITNLAKKLLWITLLGGATASAAYASGALRAAPTHQAEGSRGTPSDRALPDRGGAALGCGRLSSGVRLGFSLSSSTRYSLHTAGAQGAARTQESQEIHGSLLLRVLETGTGSITVAGVMASPRVTTSGQDVPELATALAEPVAFRMDGECRITELGATDTLPTRVRNIWKTTLKMLEFVTPAPGTARSWSVEQSDALGAFSARYTRGEGLEVRRARGAYLTLHEDMDGRITASITKGDATATWAPGGGWIQGARLDEQVRLRSGGAPLVDVQTSLHLDAEDVDVIESGFFTRSIDLRRYTFSPADRLDPDGVLLPYAEREPIEGLAGQSLDAVLSGVAALLGQPGAGFDAALNLLVQHLRLDPAHPHALLARIRAGGLDDGVRAALFLGLQLTGGAAAHGALREAAGDARLDQVDRLRAVSALGDVPDPDGNVVDALLSIRSDLGRRGPMGDELVGGAALALGTLAKNPRLDQESRRRVLEELSRDIEERRDPGTIRDGLAALGNAGDPSQRARVLPFTEHEDPTVAAEAYSALRRMKALPAPAEMLEAFAEASHPRVQAALAEGLLGQTLGAAEIERSIELLEQGPAPEARAVLIQLLGAASSESAAAKAALVRAVEVERDKALLSLLGRYLKPADLL